MNVVVRHRIMSIEDFLAWEARQELKYEFNGLEPVAMAGGTYNHAVLQRNLAISVGGRLRGKPCAYVGSDLKVVTSDRSRYPDGQVICGPVPGRATFSTTPTVLFELVSPGDENRDRVEKVHEYQAIATARRYVILEQDQVLATVMERGGQGWSSRLVRRDGILDMPEIGIHVPLLELYDGVVFDDEPNPG